MSKILYSIWFIAILGLNSKVLFYISSYPDRPESKKWNSNEALMLLLTSTCIEWAAYLAYHSGEEVNANGWRYILGKIVFGFFLLGLQDFIYRS